MNLLPNAEETALTDLLRRQATDVFPLAGRCRSATPGQWERAAGFGWFGIGQPAEHGGAGLGTLGEALLFREMGRALVPGPFLSTATTLRIALAVGWDDLSERIQSGHMRVGWVLPPRQDAESGRVRILDGGDARYALHVSGGAADVSELSDLALASPSTDESVPAWTARAGTARHAGPEVAAAASTAMSVLVAAMASGICEAVLARSISYSKTRQQFGRAIGSFQAVAHRCADMAVRAEVAWAQTVVAALSVDGGFPDAAAAAASARLLATSYAVRSAADNIQNHGGIGFTTDAEEHRFVKRAHSLRYFDSPPRDIIASILGGYSQRMPAGSAPARAAEHR